MGVDVILVQMLVFVAVLLFVLGLRSAFSRKPTAAESHKPGLYRMFEDEIRTVGNFLGPTLNAMSPAKTAQIRNDLIAAALSIEVTEVRGLQGLGVIVGGACGGAFVFLVSLSVGYALLGLLVFGWLGWAFPVIAVAGAAARRKNTMSRSLPYAIDLITVSMQAGQDFGAAVRHLVTDGPKGPLAQEFSVALRQVELGKSRVEALKAMAERIQLDEFRSLVTAVIQSTEMGASIAATMKIQAEEIRRARYHKAERQAARAPSLMLIPTALFILPAVFIIIFTPVILRMMESGIGAYFRQ